MKEFDKTQILNGILRTSEGELGEERCEVYLNRINTSELKAEIYALDASFGTKLMKKGPCEVFFDSNNEHTRTFFKGQIVKIQSDGNTDNVATIALTDFIEDYYINTNPITQCDFNFYLTDSQIFRPHVIRTTSDQKGYLVGYDTWSDQENPTWKSDEYRYVSEIGEFVFYPGLVYANVDEKVVLVRNQLMVNIHVMGESIDVGKVQVEVTKVLEVFLHILSLIENRFIKWFYCYIDARGSSKKGLVRETYKRIPSRNYTNDNQEFRLRSAGYHKIVQTMVDGYLKLSNEKRIELDKAIRQMLIGTQPGQSIENQLIYWHSCLDILINLAGPSLSVRRGLGFSKSLVDTSEYLGADWGGLYSYIKKEDIFSDEKADFKITIFRNNMIHHGIYPLNEECHEVYAENMRAATLFERMVMKIMGLEYDGTPIGKYREFR
jgi:hypothetical protein